MENRKKKTDKVWSNGGGRAGEADRGIAIKMPKHMYTGK